MMGLGSPALDAAYDRWKTTPPEEPETHFKCERCGLELYPGDDYFDCEGGVLCEECSKEWLESFKKTVSHEDCYGI